MSKAERPIYRVRVVEQTTGFLGFVAELTLAVFATTRPGLLDVARTRIASQLDVARDAFEVQVLAPEV